MNRNKYEAVVMGVSAGGMDALQTILASLPEDFPVPILIVQHISPHSDSYLARYLDSVSPLGVKEADEKDSILPGEVYLAPPNYHLLVEDDRTLSLSVEERVNFARPSVDVLFETASDVFGPHLVGIVLTGANGDGSRGLKKIAQKGGLTLVQSPDTAYAQEMPKAALALLSPDYILPLHEIGPFLHRLFRRKYAA
ncbi:MAG: chemotaxis protein CheB [Desulfococcaceae bacterium]|jgi:two-component system chemotaxis response regulator CheB|nr:chemotaxis protein CheB [Desulfococcaceae bacterium]